MYFHFWIPYIHTYILYILYIYIIYIIYYIYNEVGSKGWSRALIWASVELCKSRVNPRCHHGWRWWAIFLRLLATQNNLFLLFYQSIDGNINRLEYSDSFFVLFTVLICSDSIFNLLKRVTEVSFLFLCKKLVLFFVTFLNLGTQIKCPQNWYTDLKSA